MARIGGKGIMEYLFIYCLQLFESLRTIHAVCMSVGLVSLLVVLPIYCLLEIQKDGACDYGVKLAEKLQKIIKPIPIIFLTIGIFTLFIPTKQTLLLMGGMYLGKKAVNTVVTDEKIKKVDTIINLELDKRIKELKAEEVNK